MTAKEYLSQAYWIDKRINSKIEQAAMLRDRSLKVTSVLSEMPKAQMDVHSSEHIIAKLMDLENEINTEIDKLVDIKRDVATTINSVGNLRYQTLLELRYLCFKSWEEIATEMNYSLRWTHIMHSRALAEVERALKKTAL